ncbi:MAG: DUF86 domain-containing protein [Gammaproteobacteria bacterium]|jgi:uncharacterized protein with HEPN domain|nr:DUF86 domain-containing protein [Gammaproteobacteria bacterium]MBT3725447.1 DUF86 domain-containing protein [Gammaproteobacteria bacterium]MBT4077800.1 DUF86 domain-containing protein [Gammaproteobacteria bacterium]MBT4195560.1 DUF86 domain-containing protein [Gammaproteobacteria bacterium]MBT4448215.1 DUF86 domain-containing protein [Gammaproteobacteria bacterium]
MNEKDDNIYIEHMLDSILRIYEYVETKEDFYQSHLIQDAVIRNLQVMAESSQRLSPDIKKQYPEIPWKNISGFRNILVHDYLGVDLDMIWSVVDQELHKMELVLTEAMLP